MASNSADIPNLGEAPSKKSKKKNKQNKQQQQQQQPQKQKGTKLPEAPKQKSADPAPSNQKPKRLATDGSTVRPDPHNGELMVCKPIAAQPVINTPTNPRAPLDPAQPGDEQLDRLEAQGVLPLMKQATKFPRALYHCRLCALHIDSLARAWDHVDSNRHRLKFEIQDLQRFVAAAPSPTQSHAEGVGEHLVEHTNSLMLNSDEVERRLSIANRAIECISSGGSGSYARLYGSLAYSLATNNSDVNLSLTLVDASAVTSENKRIDAEFNNAFDRCLDALTTATTGNGEDASAATKLFAEVTSQAENLSPSILCKDSSGVSYQFSVNTGHRVHTSNLIGAYVELDNRCRRLCLALRSVANLAKADAPDRGTLPPHAYYLMVVHYLQRVSLLPVLNEIAEAPSDCFTTVNFDDGQLKYFNAGPDCLAKYWQPADADSSPAKFGRLWIDLLRYYSVPQQDSVVCITKSEPVLCSAKDWTPKRINIEDPFRARMNMARGVATNELLDYILMQIRSAYRYYAVPQLATGPLYQHFKLKTSCSSSASVKTQKLKITPLFDLGDVSLAARELVDSVPIPADGVVSTIDIVNAALSKVFSPNDKVTCSSLDLTEPDLAVGAAASTGDAAKSNPQPTVDFHRWLVQRLYSAIVRRHLARDNSNATPAQLAAIVRVAVRSARRRRQQRLLMRRRRRTTTTNTATVSVNDSELALPVPPPLQLTAPVSIEEFARQIVDNLVADCLNSVSASVDKIPDAAAAVVGNDLDAVNLSIVDDVPMEEDDFQDDGDDVDDVEGEESVDPTDELEDTEIDEELAAEGGVLDSTEPDYYNRASVEGVAKSSLRYTLDKRCLVRAPPPQLQCVSCGKAGHLKDACKEYEFAVSPSQLPGPCPPHHLANLTKLLVTVPGDFEERDQDIKKRAEVKDEILALLRVHFPDAQLDFFGSCCNGFGFRDSDLDMCLTFDSCPDMSQLRTPVASLITKVAKILKGAPSRQFYNVLPITQAKVPIVKFRHRKFDCEGDVSLYNRLASANTKMLRTYAMLDRRVRDLGYIVKVFAKSCGIGDASRGSLSSYTYVILTLHYLQSEGLVPCLQELYDGWPERPAPQRQIDGWNAWFQDDRAEIVQRWRPRSDKSIGELWLGFLRYYLEFDWRSRVVTIRRSGPLLRLEKLWSTPLAIEDPFELSHNLASGMTKKMAWFILTTFFNALKRWCTPPAEPLPDRAMKEFLFSSSLCPGDVPKDRGCKRCGKIGHLARDCGHEMRQANRMDGIRTPMKDFQREQVQIDQQSRPQLAPAESGPTGGPAILYMRQSSLGSASSSTMPSADAPASPAPSAAYQPVVLRAAGLPDLLIPLAILPAGPEELRLRGSPQAFPVFTWGPQPTQQSQQPPPQQLPPQQWRL
uniref:RNA uridylyltransferase n=1 Tax=Macrostomum lignano TaxID=282301 RepID=A0A1I8J8X7_9PLAT